MVCAQLGTGVSDASAPLVVPSSYPTIRSAVDAAGAGDTIKVLPGTYVEQVSIDKNLKITGSGSDSTIIRAPGTLVAGEDGGNSIVEIHGSASVVMSRLAVSGPGGGTCQDGALGSGIRVLGAGHLNLSFARVTHIADTPVAPCFRSATGIFVGDSPAGNASATIRHSSVSDYQGSGIVVLGEGSTATISDNVITGPGESVSTDGIELVEGAAGTVSNNVVSGTCGQRATPTAGQISSRCFSTPASSAVQSRRRSSRTTGSMTTRSASTLPSQPSSASDVVETYECPSCRWITGRNQSVVATLAW